MLVPSWARESIFFFSTAPILGFLSSMNTTLELKVQLLVNFCHTFDHFFKNQHFSVTPRLYNEKHIFFGFAEKSKTYSSGASRPPVAKKKKNGPFFFLGGGVRKRPVFFVYGWNFRCGGDFGLFRHICWFWQKFLHSGPPLEPSQNRFGHDFSLKLRFFQLFKIFQANLAKFRRFWPIQYFLMVWKPKNIFFDEN